MSNSSQCLSIMRPHAQQNSKERATIWENMCSSFIKFLRNASWKVTVPVVKVFESPDRMMEEGMRCISRWACDNGAIGSERRGIRRDTIFLMEDFPPSLNLVRKLIKLQAQRLLSLCVCFCLHVCHEACTLSIALHKNPLLLHFIAKKNNIEDHFCIFSHVTTAFMRINKEHPDLHLYTNKLTPVAIS